MKHSLSLSFANKSWSIVLLALFFACSMTEDGIYKKAYSLYSISQDSSLSYIEHVINTTKLSDESLSQLSYLAGYIHLNKRQYAEALSYYNLAASAEPSATIYRAMGHCYYNLRAYSHSLENYELARKLEGDNPLTLYDMGVVYRDKGDFEQSQEYLNKAIVSFNTTDNYDQKAKAYNELGLLFVAAELYPTGREYYEIVLTLSIEHNLGYQAQAYNNLADAYAKEGNIKLARNYLSLAIQYYGNSPARVPALLTLGDLAYADGDNPSAKAAYRAVTEIDYQSDDFDDYIQALAHLSKIYMLSGQQDSSLYYMHLIAQSSKYPEVSENMNKVLSERDTKLAAALAVQNGLSFYKKVIVYALSILIVMTILFFIFKQFAIDYRYKMMNNLMNEYRKTIQQFMTLRGN